MEFVAQKLVFISCDKFCITFVKVGMMLVFAGDLPSPQ